MTYTSIEEVTPFQLGQNFAREGKDYCPYKDSPENEREFYLGVEAYKRRTIWPRGCPTTRVEQDDDSN